MNNQIKGAGDYNVVIKVGSNVLYWEETWINKKVVQNIVDGIACIRSTKRKVLLVTSWSVAVGRKFLEKRWKKFEGTLSPKDQAKCSRIWQPILMNAYGDSFKKNSELFNRKPLFVSQSLLTHRDLELQGNKEWTLDLLNDIEEDEVPVINANDVTSSEELADLKFSDNDQLAGLIAKWVNARILMILSDIDGFYTNYGKENQKLVPTINDTDMDELMKYIHLETSRYGTGWMRSKMETFRSVMQEGIWGILANGKKENVIQDAFQWGMSKTMFRWVE